MLLCQKQIILSFSDIMHEATKGNITPVGEYWVASEIYHQKSLDCIKSYQQMFFIIRLQVFVNKQTLASVTCRVRACVCVYCGCGLCTQKQTLRWVVLLSCGQQLLI